MSCCFLLRLRNRRDPCSQHRVPLSATNPDMYSKACTHYSCSESVVSSHALDRGEGALWESWNPEKRKLGCKQGFNAAVASEVWAKREEQECVNLRTALQSCWIKNDIIHFYSIRVHQSFFDGTINYGREKSAHSVKPYVKPGNSRAGAGSSRWCATWRRRRLQPTCRYGAAPGGCSLATGWLSVELPQLCWFLPAAILKSISSYTMNRKFTHNFFHASVHILTSSWPLKQCAFVRYGQLGWYSREEQLCLVAEQLPWSWSNTIQWHHRLLLCLYCMLPKRIICWVLHILKRRQKGVFVQRAIVLITLWSLYSVPLQPPRQGKRCPRRRSGCAPPLPAARYISITERQNDDNADPTMLQRLWDDSGDKMEHVLASQCLLWI